MSRRGDALAEQRAANAVESCVDAAGQDPALRVRVLARNPISLFAAPAYLSTRGLPRTVADVAGHDVVVPSGELEGLPEARWLRERPNVHATLRSSRMPALVEAAVQGHGLIALTRSWGESIAGLDHVVEISTLAARPVWLAFHPDVVHQPAVRLVADRLVAGFRTR